MDILKDEYPEEWISARMEYHVATTVTTGFKDIELEISNLENKIMEKNPAYGRQSISPPMRIVAPMP